MKTKQRIALAVLGALALTGTAQAMFIIACPVADKYACIGACELLMCQSCIFDGFFRHFHE